MKKTTGHVDIVLPNGKRKRLGKRKIELISKEKGILEDGKEVYWSVNMNCWLHDLKHDDEHEYV